LSYLKKGRYIAVIQLINGIIFGCVLISTNEWHY